MEQKLPFVVMQNRMANIKCNCCFTYIQRGHHYVALHTDECTDVILCFRCIKAMKRAVAEFLPPIKEEIEGTPVVERTFKRHDPNVRGPVPPDYLSHLY